MPHPITPAHPPNTLDTLITPTWRGQVGVGEHLLPHRGQALGLLLGLAGEQLALPLELRAVRRPRLPPLLVRLGLRFRLLRRPRLLLFLLWQMFR